jgi:hypothetical protein
MPNVLGNFHCYSMIVRGFGNTRAALRFCGKAEPLESAIRHSHNVQLTNVASALPRIMKLAVSIQHLSSFPSPLLLYFYSQLRFNLSSTSSSNGFNTYIVITIT